MELINKLNVVYKGRKVNRLKLSLRYEQTVHLIEFSYSLVKKYKLSRILVSRLFSLLHVTLKTVIAFEVYWSILSIIYTCVSLYNLILTQEGSHGGYTLHSGRETSHRQPVRDIAALPFSVLF